MQELRCGYRKQCARSLGRTTRPGGTAVTQGILTALPGGEKRQPFAGYHSDTIVQEAKRDLPAYFGQHFGNKPAGPASTYRAQETPQSALNFFHYRCLINMMIGAVPVPPLGEPREEPDMILNVAAD